MNNTLRVILSVSNFLKFLVKELIVTSHCNTIYGYINLSDTHSNEVEVANVTCIKEDKNKSLHL